MKKTIRVGIILITSVFMLTGCCLEHEWEKATCTEPITCEKCGKTEGEPLGHEWDDATCENPKTCEVCDETKGEALGHDWMEATCENPKTCSVCQEIEGEALGHDWTEATCTVPQTCSVCQKEGDTLEHDVYYRDGECNDCGEFVANRIADEEFGDYFSVKVEHDRPIILTIEARSTKYKYGGYLMVWYNAVEKDTGQANKRTVNVFLDENGHGVGEIKYNDREFYINNIATKVSCGHAFYY